jgi:type II secretory pathway pseudopilin PulG
MKRRRENTARRPGAFTFVEVLASLLFLGLLIPVVVSALTLSNRASVTAERAATAAQLAEAQLNELIVTGEAATSASGDFGEERPGYRWELTSTDWTTDTMTELTMTVFFPVQGQEQQVQVTTLQEQ